MVELITELNINDFKPIIDGNIILGNTVVFDNREWLVCHIDNSVNKAYLAHNGIASNTEFGPTSAYNISDLRQVAKDFENSMSQEAKDYMLNTTVNSVTAKIFVASYNQMNGDFSWFNSNSRRVCENRSYWTSSAVSSSSTLGTYYSWYVNSSGNLIGNTGIIGGGTTNTYGFRPFCCIPLST